VLFNAATRTRLLRPPLDVPEGRVTSVAFSPDGKTFTAGFENGVVLFDSAVWRRLTSLPLNVKGLSVCCVAFDTHGKTVAVGYGIGGPYAVEGGGMVLFDTVGRKRSPDVPIAVKQGYVTGVAFSPDGKTAAAGYKLRSAIVIFAGGVVLRDTVGPKRLTDVAVKEGNVTGVSFSPDGSTLAAGYVNPHSMSTGGVVLFDAATGKRLTEEPFNVEQGGVGNMAFSPDGGTLAAGYDIGDSDGICNGGVVLLDLDLESWQRRAGRMANRNFTRDEWRRYFPDEPYRPTFPDLPLPPEISSNNAVGSR
jgi:WD40 repeat protein